MSKIFTLILLIVTLSRYVLSEFSSSFCDPIESAKYTQEGTTTGDVVERKTNDDRKTITKCICPKDKCSRKCCPIGYAYDRYSKSCVVSQKTFNPPVGDYDFKVHKNVNVSDLFHFMIGNLECHRHMVAKVYTKYLLTLDGKLIVYSASNEPSTKIYTTDHYCLDNIISIKPSVDINPQEIGMFCYVKEPNKAYIYRSTCMLISCVFLLTTVVVYAWVPALRTRHGRILMAYLLCLLMKLFFLALMMILLYIDYIYSDACLTLTILIYFFYESCMFWLNVMCYDIFKSLCDIKTQTLQEKQRSNNKKFKLYSIYAFGIPSVLTILLVSLEFSGLEPDPLQQQAGGTTTLLPQLRTKGCFIEGTSKFLYLYGPVSILFVMNIILYVLTIKDQIKRRKENSVLKSNDSRIHNARKEKKRFVLYIELFAIMGVTWILDLASEMFPEAGYLWEVTDFFNIFTGVTIFIITICKKQIINSIKTRLAKIFNRISLPKQTNPNLSNNENNSGSFDITKLTKIFNRKSLPKQTNPNLSNNENNSGSFDIPKPTDLKEVSPSLCR